MSKDFFLSIIIVIVFFLISINGILLTQYELIKKQWPKLKCNPLVMPFASFFGEDPLDNFQKCIKDIQVGYMDIALAPLNLNIGVLGNIGVELLDAIVSVRQMLNFLRNALVSITSSIFSIFSNVLVEFQKLSLAVKDSVEKMVAVMTVMSGSLKGGIMTMKSAWKGPPGEMLRGIAGLGREIRKLEIDPFCFHPDTLLQLENNNYVKMKDITLGSKLKNGSIVEGILKINNVDKKGSFKEKLYKLLHGENKTPVYVTGKHLVYSENKIDYVKNHKDAIISEVNTKELSCLITNDHLIPIGKYVFWDWEDTEEMTAHLK
jgi:hypothetical protein